jgi:hypothetical protein
MCRPGDSPRLEKKKSREMDSGWRDCIQFVRAEFPSGSGRSRWRELYGDGKLGWWDAPGALRRWQIADKIRVERRHHASTYFEVASLMRDINLVQTIQSLKVSNQNK